jgi:hypothetical protein
MNRLLLGLSLCLGLSGLPALAQNQTAPVGLGESCGEVMNVPLQRRSRMPSIPAGLHCRRMCAGTDGKRQGRPSLSVRKLFLPSNAKRC